MEEWKEYKLGDVVNILDYKRIPLSSKERSTRQGHYPYYGAQGIIDYIDDYIFDGTYLLIAEDGENLKSQKQNIAQLAYGKYWVNNHAHIVETNGKSDIRYICYLLNTIDLSGYITGSAQPKLNQANLTSITLFLPSLGTQKRIADYLSVFDDKIEVNRRINDNLEQQAQALFKSWFVDFEPFKNGEFVDSELGRIPKGWKLTYISEIIHVLETGRRPKGGVGEIKGGIPSVGAEHIKGIGNYDYSKTKYINEEFASSLKTGKIKGYELLIYKDGGKPGYFIPNYSIFGEGYPFEECFLNEHVFKLDFGDKGYNAFCYFYFHTDYVMNYLNAQGGKAAIPGINKQDVENILVFAPENEVVMKFSKFVLPLIKQILMNCNESRRLAELRDTLLPKLMSGELKVSEINM